MSPSLRSDLTTASIVGLMLASVFIIVVTIVADLYLVDSVPVFKNWFKDSIQFNLQGKMQGHHWVGKGIWTLVVFLVTTGVTLPFVRRRGTSASAFMLRLGANIIILGALILTAFFLYEYAKH